MEDIVIDSTILVEIVIFKNYALYKKLRQYRVFVPANCVEEVCFKIIIATLAKNLKDYKFYEVKKKWEKGSSVEDVEERFDVLKDILTNFIVTPINEEILLNSFDIQLKYKLLPNDALIAATCKYYSIKKIATFDDDFRRVDFLEVIDLKDGGKEKL